MEGTRSEVPLSLEVFHEIYAPLHPDIFKQTYLT
jgi:hypothetical protein